MTNKTTPDEDWLSTILADLLNNTHNAPEMAIRKYSGEARAAINAKITELLVAELENIAVKLIKAVGGANYITNIPIERIIELQASQPINEQEEK
jgi:hypothetical protein